jgi:predicted lipoprotein
VKISFREYQRRGLIPLAGLALAAYYLFVLLPLARQAESLDEPLQKAWQKLSVSLDLTNALAINFLRITNQLSETRQALLILENAKQQATVRLQLGPAVRGRMHADFQLVDYENERSRQMDELSNLAKQQQATVEPAVLAGFPEHTADVKQASLLWAALALTESLIRTALQCKVAAIHSLEVPPVLTNAPPTNATDRLAEIPLQVEFTASAASAARLIQCLPLRADEIRAAGLPEAPADKPALYVDRLIIQKQSPDKSDEVHVWLRAVGFVLRE